MTVTGADDGDRAMMARALVQARRAAAAGEVPVGAVVVGADGVILAEAGNTCVTASDPAGHAEMVAVRQAGQRVGNYRLPGATLVVTLEPCAMCAGAIVAARIQRLVFGAFDPKAGAVASLWDLVRDPRLNHRVEVISGILAGEAEQQLRSFFGGRRG